MLRGIFKKCSQQTLALLSDGGEDMKMTVKRMMYAYNRMWMNWTFDSFMQMIVKKRTIDLTDNEVITDRDVSVSLSPYAIDVNQANGTYAVVEPYGDDGSYNGRVVIYPQSPVPEVSAAIELKTFNRVGSLYYPLDAKFDYLRRKIWIADSGSHRVLKVNLNTNQVDLSIDEGMVYPHALAVNFNTGGVFVKGYESYDLNSGSIFYYQKDGTLLSTFSFHRNDTDNSSSSSSNDGTMSSSSSSSSSSGALPLPVLPSSKSIVFDHVRSRVWWVDNIRIYMADIRNKQVQTYDVRDDSFTEAINLSIEFSTGNVLVVVKNIHNESFLIQMNRDNNILINTAYIQG